MSTPPAGLLFVFGEAGEVVGDDAFNDWYDNEHVPLRMAIPAFHNTSRWQAADGLQPTYLAMYDLDSSDVLAQAPYSTLAGSASERERGVLRNVQLLDRRAYDVLPDAQLPPPPADYTPRAPGPCLIVLQIAVSPDLEDDLNRWYREEHLPLLAQVPGWRRSRRFVLRDAGPAKGRDAAKAATRDRLPKYLAVHEWESAESFETKEFKDATSTEWRMRLFESAEVWDRRLMTLMRAWTQD